MDSPGSAAQRLVDLNSDIGERPDPEGLSADAELLQVITSANVACGGHTGDHKTMRFVCERAVEHQVAIGAQVSYVDREAFGRRPLDIAPDVLVEQLAEQWQTLESIAHTAGGSVDYIRPHGALYNQAMVDVDVASAVLRAVPAGTPVLCLPGSALANVAAAAGSQVTYELFADRAITAQGELVTRGQSGAILVDPVTVIARLRTWLATGQMRSHTGEIVAMAASSICIHSDTPGSLDLARRIRQALEADGADVQPFSRLRPS